MSDQKESENSADIESLFAELGLPTKQTIPAAFNGKWFANGPTIDTLNPATNEVIARVQMANADDYESCLTEMAKVKKQWAATPAPKRGEVVRIIGDMLRDKREALGKLVSLENGKILAEGVGEVQEAIDICEFAVGLSRCLNGQVIPSERPEHMMMECWHPLNGHLGMITAFNFPVAVAFWNSALSLVCGNTQIWKGSEAVPLVTMACGRIIAAALEKCGYPGSIACTLVGTGAEVGSKIGADERIELVSFTGSTATGQKVNAQLAPRFGKAIMELGGNNGCIVMDDANLDIALDGVFFSAVGTAGQRCTSLRRLFLHEKIYDKFLDSLLNRYKTVRIGDPLDSKTLCGPLISETSVANYEKGIEAIRKSKNAKIMCGGNVLSDRKGNFVEPTIVCTEHSEAFVNKELFGPVLYVIKFSSFDQVLELHNSVAHGLSSALFTKSHEHIFRWMGPLGSDCGIVNTNIGTSGAEIGGAFGGEKMTGKGRESGSDAWKQYCRRVTATVNYSKELPLAQGITFA